MVMLYVLYLSTITILVRVQPPMPIFLFFIFSSGMNGFGFIISRFCLVPGEPGSNRSVVRSRDDTLQVYTVFRTVYIS